VVLRNAEKFLVRDAHGKIVVRDGLPVVGYRNVVFQNKREQDEYLARRGWARLADGEADSTVSEESTHSAFSQGDTPPPTPEAVQLAEQTFFVENVQEYGC
jgi:hypothetical protein